MNSHIRPYAFIALRLPSGQHKILKVLPDTLITLGKYGSFWSNLLIGRPFYTTYEICDKLDGQTHAELRIVPAAELHAEAVAEDLVADPGLLIDVTENDDQSLSTIDAGVEGGGRNNQKTIDDTARQTMSMEDIEELKKLGGGSGRDVIAKIMQSHSAIDEKTAFSLAKYALRKSKKYMRHFTPLPLDVSMLANWMLNEKEPARIMEIREEMFGLIASFSNVHFGAELPPGGAVGRYLVVDDTGGLVVAALAERMGILNEGQEGAPDEAADNTSNVETLETPHPSINDAGDDTAKRRFRPRKHASDSMSAGSNTITLIHSATQPNISLLSYFSYDPTDITGDGMSNHTSHPLHTHLKTISWLQLISPEDDSAMIEPEHVDEDVLSTWKSGKRGTYYRKRRRWERTTRVVEETLAGGYDGLVAATSMDPASVLQHTVPLLAGGASIVVYSPNVEPLAELVDLYSSARKTGFLEILAQGQDPQVPSEDFPVDPRLILAPTVFTARARQWQVLPGRTHPVMTSRGGAEGYLLTGTRVLPVEGKLDARGKFSKRRKVGANGAADTTPTETQ